MLSTAAVELEASPSEQPRWLVLPRSALLLLGWTTQHGCSPGPASSCRAAVRYVPCTARQQPWMPHSGCASPASWGSSQLCLLLAHQLCQVQSTPACMSDVARLERDAGELCTCCQSAQQLQQSQAALPGLCEMAPAAECSELQHCSDIALQAGTLWTAGETEDLDWTKARLKPMR